MKIKLKVNIRKRVVTVLSVLLLVLLGMTAWKFLQPLRIEKDVPLYKFTQQAQVNYLVHILPNSFFPEKSAGPGRAYITSLTDNIETQLVYQIAGESPAQVKGDVQVTAVLAGYIYKDKKGGQPGEKEKVVVWSKTTPLLESTPYSGNKAKSEFTKVVNVDLNQFKAFAEQVGTELKNPAELVELTVIYNVSARVANEQGNVESKVAPQLVIPIKGNTFMVDGVLLDKKEGAITEKKTVEVPGARTGRIVYGGITLFATLLLLIVVFGTGIEDEDPLEKELGWIMKKHGDMIVEAQGAVPGFFNDEQVVVHAFIDLVKVASELGRPILFEDTGQSVYNFYVANEPLVYTYTLDALSVLELISTEAPRNFKEEASTQ